MPITSASFIGSKYEKILSQVIDHAVNFPNDVSEVSGGPCYSCIKPIKGDGKKVRIGNEGYTFCSKCFAEKTLTK